MLTKTLARRTRKARSLVAAIEVFRKKIAGKLVDRVAPHVEDGEDFAEALDLVHRVLQRMLRDQSAGEPEGSNRPPLRVVASGGKELA
jgi:hypothetical protein